MCAATTAEPNVEDKSKRTRARGGGNGDNIQVQSSGSHSQSYRHHDNHGHGKKPRAHGKNSETATAARNPRYAPQVFKMFQRAQYLMRNGDNVVAQRLLIRCLELNHMIHIVG